MIFNKRNQNKSLQQYWNFPPPLPPPLFFSIQCYRKCVENGKFTELFFCYDQQFLCGHILWDVWNIFYDM